MVARIVRDRLGNPTMPTGTPHRDLPSDLLAEQRHTDQVWARLDRPSGDRLCARLRDAVDDAAGFRSRRDELKRGSELEYGLKGNALG